MTWVAMPQQGFQINTGQIKANWSLLNVPPSLCNNAWYFGDSQTIVG